MWFYFLSYKVVNEFNYFKLLKILFLYVLFVEEKDNMIVYWKLKVIKFLIYCYLRI